jgi:hypothetical protein
MAPKKPANPLAMLVAGNAVDLFEALVAKGQEQRNAVLMASYWAFLAAQTAVLDNPAGPPSDIRNLNTMLQASLQKAMQEYEGPPLFA